MTQRRRSQSIGLLVTVVFSAVLLWALAAVLWPVPGVYANPPNAVDDSATVDEGGTVTMLDSSATSVLDNDIDPEGHTLTVSTTVSGPSYGTLTLNADGTFEYTHDDSENHSDSFVYEVCDTEPACDTATVNITVTAVNDPPVVSDIPDQTINEGETFTTINLDGYVDDVDNTDAEMTWTSTGNTELTVDITDRVATIGIPGADWNGSEIITFRATDPGLLWDEDAATFTVNADNDAPVVSDIPGQAIAGGAAFATINLDDYVSDVDNTDAEMTWTSTGNTELTVDITARVATIGIPGADWNGSETITFRATDPGLLWDEDAATFTQDSVDPTVELTDVTDPGYDSDDDELDDDYSNWYNAGDFTAGGGGGWAFNSNTDDVGTGLASCAALWDHSNDTDHTTGCSLAGDGSFSGLNGEDDGTVTVRVIVTDQVGNTASDRVRFNIDNTEPTITSPYISEGSDYLYADGLTIHYGDGMGSAAQTFTVNGHSSDGSGVGLNEADTVDFSFALLDNPSNLGTPEDWWGEYTAASYNTDSGQIIVTVYDLLDNPTTQVFIYTRDTDDPDSEASSPDYDNGNPIVVTYSNATDNGSSGLRWVQLWYKKEGSVTWAPDSGSPAQTGPSGSFNFFPTEGDGTYCFASVATDNVGNQEDEPTGSGDDDTLYDTIAPSVPEPVNFAYQPDSDSGGDGIDPLPGYYDDTVIELEWDPFTDDGSGLLTPPYHLGTAPHPTGGSYAKDSPYNVGSNGTYNIYLTAEDNAGNISGDAVTEPVVVDTQAPQGSVDCPEGTAEFSFDVGWSATDQGGLRSEPYDVQYEVDGDNNWHNWLMATSAVTAIFGSDSPVTVEYDHTYCFRMRAVDRAGNVTTYTSGNDCTEVSEIYGPDVKKIFLPIIMVPDPNWGFEAGSFTSWQHGGQLAQSVSKAMPHSGSYSARLGSPNYACSGVPVGSAWLRRSVTVPSSGSPTLSFYYRIFTQDKTASEYLDVSGLADVPSGDRFAVEIKGEQVFADANTTKKETCAPPYDLDWKEGGIPLDNYKGQTIEITFHNYNWPDNWFNTYTYVDDVSVQ